MSFNLRAAVFSVLAGASLLTSGCASLPASETNSELLVAPVLPDYKLEVTLAKLNEILARAELTTEQRARFHYDRGVIYDSVGLRILARIDFHQALKLQPNLADAYNFLGIYYTQEGEFESAYEAFDAVLELSPEYDYAFLNRGIALYYGERKQLAAKDMESFYLKDESDGYRALWLYLIEYELSPQEALARLQFNRTRLDDNAWATVLVDYYLGAVDESRVFAMAKSGLTHPKEYAERLCETYFYLAKVAAEQGDKDKAADYLRLALATNIYDFVEHRYARMELALLEQTPEPVQQTAN